jgi:hypothetical protein
MALARMSLLELPTKLRKVSDSTNHCICSFKVRNIVGGQQTDAHYY